MNPGVFLEVKQLSLTRGNIQVLKDISFTIRDGEQWAIVGASGSGKSSLAQALAGSVFHGGEIQFALPQGAHVELVEQQHRFKTLSNTSDFYYQQRYNSADADNSLRVRELLNVERDQLHPVLKKLHVDILLDKPLIQLSNGENKRVQLAKVILKNPAAVILDNPFVGLDVDGRAVLHSLIDNVIRLGIHIIIVTSPTDLPSSITHVAVLENGTFVFTGTKEVYQHTFSFHHSNDDFDFSQLDFFPPSERFAFEKIIEMRDVHVEYDGRVVLSGVNWLVQPGDCWSLSGANGAGKSTLLSLVNGDNPQAYANEIFLFDRKRGTGESIWDIKRHIGFVSPELHLFFDSSATVFNAVASGLFDTIGLFRQLSSEQEASVAQWLKLLRIEGLRHRLLTSLSGGQQRLVMLARALVKNPPLLILDEPCQGLDENQSSRFKKLIEIICAHFHTTLIYVSHYQQDIPACVDKFIRLEDGRRIQ